MSTDLPRASSNADPLQGPRAELAKVIPRRKRVTWWIGLLLAAGFALALLPTITAERWLAQPLQTGQPAPYTVRIPQFAGLHTSAGHIGGGGILIARGEPVTDEAQQIDTAMPQGPTRVVAFLLLLCVLGGLFTHHMQRSNHGRRLRTQLVNLALIVVTAFVVKAVMLTTAVSVLVVPVALLAMVPTLALDRVVGLATGTLAALILALLVPFDVGVAVVLLVQVAVSGLVIAERPKHVERATLIAGAVTTVCSAFVYPLLTYLTAGTLPLAELDHPLRSPWLACAIGPVLATALAIIAMPIYQLLVGEITRGKLVELEDLSNPLLRQIAEKSPGTWQHSLMMANMAEIAANAIGANGRLVRVGAYYHDLGKSLQPKYFIENLEPGETSPHDKLPPEVSCDAIFAHVTEGIVSARKAGLHERIIDFMHMHHGNGVLEYFWSKCQEKGNPSQLSVEHFRYPGVPPQTRETAILAICDAVEAASRTLKKPDTKSIDALVQRIVYGKLHLGQLDESGLSMGDLRRVADSLRETIKHANHGRIEYPWQKAGQDASATPEPVIQTGPRLDSLDRPARADSVRAPSAAAADALADTASNTPDIRKRPSQLEIKKIDPSPLPAAESQAAMPAARHSVDSLPDAHSPEVEASASADTQPAMPKARNSDELALLSTAPFERPSDPAVTQPRRKITEDDDIGPLAEPPKPKRPAALVSTASSVPTSIVDEDTGRRRKPSSGPETAAFVAEAKSALAEASKDLGKTDDLAIAKESSDPEISIKHEAPEPSRAEPTSGARKRAATLPPTAGALRRPPTVPPPTGRRSPTIPPGMLPAAPPASGSNELPGLPPKPGPASALFSTSATVPSAPGLNATLPPPSAMRAPAIVVEEAPDGTMKMEPSKFSMSDAAITQPRMTRASDDGSDFGTDTPTRAPTRAELQALRDSPPDPTRKQTVEEIEALHLKSLDRPSDPELVFEPQRRPHPTTEVHEEDIEAAIELAPAARKSSVGVAKKKPE